MANRKFRNLTLTQKTIHFLKNKKFKEIQSKSGKYRVFVQSDTSLVPLYYFVGKAGAVRYGETPASSKSRSISSLFKQKVKEWGLNQKQNEMVKIL